MKTIVLFKMNKIIKSTLLLFVFALILQSCVSIDTTSYSDPDFMGKQYNKLCVYSVDQNLNKRKLIENIFVKELKENGIDALEGSNLFPPTREWQETDFQSQLTKFGYDGFLKIEIVDENIKERVTPQVHTDTKTTTVKKKDGKDATITETNSYVTNDVDVYMNNQFQADLIDVATNKIAWKGYSSTSAQLNMIGIDIDAIVEKFAESVIEELQTKKHLKKE